jgi:hypothetical protein
MRRDVYIENDSGGFSVLAADAVDAIIDDARADDSRFVATHKAMLLELYGDDSMPVRIVVDEPLSPEEDAQWLARATWQIDAPDGRMLVMGGFDPDVLSWWKNDGGAGDGRGVAEVTAAPGRWRVDIYAHAGSMNGRVMLSEAGEKPGAAFRRSHPGRPFPLWLAKMLEFSGEDDPGFEELWRDVKGSMDSGKLGVETEGGDAVGFLVHFSPATGSPGEPPEGVWFGRADHGRVPDTFPVGLVSAVPDPDLRSFHDRLLGIRRPEPPRPVADRVVEIMEVWSGDPLRPIEGGAVALGLGELYLLHWMTGLTTDATPRFELWIEPKGAWTPPTATPDFAVVAKSGRVTAIGPVANTGGWHTWWTSRDVARALAGVPDGSNVDLAMRPDQGEGEPTSRAGVALYSGTVQGGSWQVSDASPAVSRDRLEQALAFVRDLLSNRMRVRTGAERAAFDAVAEAYSPGEGSLRWEGDVVSLAEPDERMHLMLSPPVFRVRFGDVWPMDDEEDEGDDDGAPRERGSLG